MCGAAPPQRLTRPGAAARACAGGSWGLGFFGLGFMLGTAPTQ